MIKKEVLLEISERKVEAAEVLFKANKYDESLYIIGYAIEMALKFKICKILKLDQGFPETKQEYIYYVSNSEIELGKTVENLKEIRNHDLQKLLFYSGQEYSIKLNLLEDWTNITYWNPELRYKINIGEKDFNKTILISTKKLIELILI